MVKPALVVLHQLSGITIAFMAMVMLVLFTSCSGRKKVFADAVSERDSLPVLATYDVNSLISDSGVIRYRIIADEWLVFDKKNPSYWAFEKGVYLEKFDLNFNIDASIKADTAYYYDKDRLWELRGSVSIQNIQGEKFDTEELFWNERTQRVYSDKFIRIEQPERIVTGEGFESNQQMTDYVIFKPGGIFYVKEEEDEEEEAPTDSLTTDTIQQRL